MGLTLNYIEGQTPIDEDEKKGLLIKTITARKELDEFEQLNIQEAVEWTMRRNKIKLSNILTEQFIKNLHKTMFRNVWKWAGTFRKTDKNIGVEWHQVSIDLRNLIDDCNYWIQNKTHSEDEIAVRFKYRIVTIHPFPNGNGRHSRLIADILIHQGFGRDIFTWGGGNISKEGGIRSAYISALKEADNGNFPPLITFARS
jgi:Fic-DOC domain mobile mystery protein B